MADDAETARGPRAGGGAARALDVAALAGVSTATVSRSFNAPEKVAPLIRERVLAIRPGAIIAEASHAWAGLLVLLSAVGHIRILGVTVPSPLRLVRHHVPGLDAVRVLAAVSGAGIVTAALALLAFSWGAARLSPTALTVATLVEPLTAVLLAALLLGQSLTPPQWLGTALLLASIWGLSRRGRGPG